jgi:hypothetical protein
MRDSVRLFMNLFLCGFLFKSMVLYIEYCLQSPSFVACVMNVKKKMHFCILLITKSNIIVKQSSFT